MKILSCLVAAVAATALVSTSAASAAVPVSSAVHAEQKDKPGHAKGKSKDKDKDKDKKKGANGNNGRGNANAGNGNNSNNGNAANGNNGNAANGNAANSNGADNAHRNDAQKRGDGPSSRSRNENPKITYCHVPPGNADNGHLITTSVNAITPGHTNHPGDIIPPFSYVKHGETVTFAGQNWDAEGRALLDSGCRADAPAEDQRITFCHVPPGNPDAAHLITTAPEALSGHTNHEGDVIPPVTYVKGGETVTFAGQNWDAAGQALLDRGCLSAAVAGVSDTVDPAEVESASASGVKGTFAKRAVDKKVADEGVLDAVLPEAGGARLGLLLLGVGLLAAGVYLVSRRRWLA